MDLLSWSRHFRNLPGQGSLPIDAFLAAVEATGYEGYLSLEIFNDQFRAGSTRMVAVDGQRSLIAAMDDVARRRRARGEAGAQRPFLPERGQGIGVEFVEFAVNEEGAERLSALIGALGFSLAGRHISKDVAWWRQGGINLVINAEKEGFAHAYYLTHGSGVCAIGLRVDDAAATVARARALLARPFHQPVGPGELEIPAIRGLGGSLIYFLDRQSPLGRVWEIEFSPPLSCDATGDAGLRNVDHLSQSMEYDEMLSWVLFYTALLDVERTPALDVADPGGLVRSQVVETADGSVRIALNGTQSRRTMSGRFLSEFMGSGVQHIAFACDDLLATATRLKERGLETLPIPDNYYDDLGAKFALDPDFLERLRSAGALYDRDDGEYLQLYTRTFEDRFFLEIVERRQGYRGFGAANASIRLAAQARSARHAVPW
jgi:4-hydroxyphenylpyruvate dioxygenase